MHFVADRLSRVASAEQLSGRFERAAGFDLETWWSRTGDQFARGNEQYRFTALVRRNRVEFLRMYVGGRVQVDTVDAQWARARLEVASPEAAVMIVLGLGQDAVVIEPDELPLLVRRAAAGRPLYEATTPHRPTPSYALG
jgi:predicted DNA-binding transcriptional regulator YafY